jgi:hypothetical protein
LQNQDSIMPHTYEGIVHQGHIKLPGDVVLPEGTRVHVTILPDVDEHTARRKANRWLAENVGDMVMADQGLFDASGRQGVWRFGVFVTALSHEPFGPIGSLDVDAKTGNILADESHAADLAQRGEHLEGTSLPSRD